MPYKKTLLATLLTTAMAFSASSSALSLVPTGYDRGANASVSIYVEQLAENRQQRISQYRDMIRAHLNQNFSIVRTARILTTHYPKDVKEILLAAFQQEPNYIPVISRAVIRSEPALTVDVLDTAFAAAPEHYESLISMAIDAEPAYIDDIVAVAAQHRPERLDTIVRIAITAEPDFSGSVVRSAGLSSPGNLLSAIVETIKNIPQSTTNVLAAVKDYFTESEQDALPKTSDSDQQWQRFIVQAKRAGVTEKEMQWFEERGYITEQQIAAVYHQAD